MPAKLYSGLISWDLLKTYCVYLSFFLVMIVAMAISRGEIYVFYALAAVSVAILARNPELAIALLFNGTFVYFYALYKLGESPDSMLTGMFYGGLNFAGILGLFHYRLRHHIRFKFNHIDFVVMAFFLVLTFSFMIFSSEKHSAIVRLRYAPFMALGPYIIGRLVYLGSGNQLKRIFGYVVLSTLTLIPPSIYELFFNPATVVMQRFALFNFQGMDNPIMFGITFSVGIIVVVNYVAHHGRISWVELIYVALSGFMVLRSGSRGALLSLLVTVLVMLGFISRISIFRKSLLLGVLLIIGAAVYVLTPDSTISFYADTLTEESLTNIDGSVGVRVSLWRSAYQDFLENPILGAGFGNSSAGGYPHNIILELAGEMGLIGFAIFSLMVFASLRNAIGVLRKYGRREQSYLVSTGVLLFLYFLIEALFSGYITQQLGLFMCMGILASATYIREVTGDGVGHR